MSARFLKVLIAALTVLSAAAIAPAAPDTQPAADDADSSPLTLITVHMKETPPGEVLGEISRQARVKIKTLPDQLFAGRFGQIPQVISLDVDDALFWPAVAQFCSAAHVAPTPGGLRDGVITFSQAPVSAGQLGGVMCVSGLFCFVATGMQHNVSVRFDNSNTFRSDSLQLTAYVDPNLAVSSWAPPVVETAVDEAGVSLVPPRAPAPPPNIHQVINMVPAQGGIISVSIPMRLPAHHGKRLADMRGSMSVTVALKTDRLTIDDARAAVGNMVAKGDRTLTINTFNLNGNVGDLQITGVKPQVPGFIMGSFMEELRRGVRIYDADGTEIGISQNGSGNPGRVQWNFRLVKPGQAAAAAIKEPIKVVWEFVTGSRTMTAAFEFKDLLLPED